jgi:hypothetical protein
MWTCSCQKFRPCGHLITEAVIKLRNEYSINCILKYVHEGSSFSENGADNYHIVRNLLNYVCITDW